jgi:tripartite ATP-independent transporter DctM subunit
MIWIAFGALAVFMFGGMPIVFALGLSSVVAIYFGSDLPMMLVAQRIVGQIDTFALLAVPFFVLVGEIMDRGGMARQLVRVSECIVGHFRGGLAHVCILASMLFAGITGSSAADASAVGSILIPAMEKRGYGRPFAAALTAGAAVMGPIVPPSTLAIIYSSITNISVGKLFLAGIVPGILVGISLMLAVRFIYADKLKLPIEPRATGWDLVAAIREAGWALVVPVMIIGGILSGIFTATESGMVVVLYSLFVSMVIQRKLRPSDLPELFLRASMTSGIVMIVIASAGPFAWILASENLPILLRDFLLGISSNRYVVLFLILTLMLVVGCVMEIVPAGIIMIPVLHPIAQSFQFDPIHFALLIVMVMAVGAVTPPMGVTTYITLSIAKTTLRETSRYLVPFIGVIVLVIALVAVFPPLATLIPTLVTGP